MTRPRNDIERLRNLLDAVEESILSATDAEIIAESTLEGRQVSADAIRGMIQDLTEEHKTITTGG